MGVTFLTGASSGIGRSLARRLAAEGEAVAVVARRAALLETLVEEIHSAGGRALGLPCDVTEAAALRTAVLRCEQQLGSITRLVANAGGGEPTRIHDFSARQVADCLALNVVGVAHCIEAVLPGMLERRSGQLVAVSSLAASRGLPGAAAYSAAKAALSNLMESLRIDLRPHGIDVTLLAPGFVRTRPGGRSRRARPFRMELEPATEQMLRAIRERRPYAAFPFPLAALAGFGRLLPASVYDRLLRGRGPKARED